jgi:hypothetical protein
LDECTCCCAASQAHAAAPLRSIAGGIVSLVALFSSVPTSSSVPTLHTGRRANQRFAVGSVRVRVVQFRNSIWPTTVRQHGDRFLRFSCAMACQSRDYRLATTGTGTDTVSFLGGFQNAFGVDYALHAFATSIKTIQIMFVLPIAQPNVACSCDMFHDMFARARWQLGRYALRPFKKIAFPKPESPTPSAFEFFLLR